MQLELASFKINRVELGREMTLHGQTLTVNPDAIRETFLHDSAFEDVTIDVAHPGESLRIVHVLDAIEPRVKRPVLAWPFQASLDRPRLWVKEAPPDCKVFQSCKPLNFRNQQVVF